MQFFTNNANFCLFGLQKFLLLLYLMNHIYFYFLGIPFETDDPYNSSSSSLVSEQYPKSNNERIFSCSYCSYSTSAASNLKSHVMIHTKEKPHKCTFCSKTFIQSSNLKRHVRIHTGEKPYVCTFCFRSFSDKGNFEKHKRRHMYN